MKRIAVAAFLFCISLIAHSQDTTAMKVQTAMNNGVGVGKNIVKLNLSSLAFKNIHVMYERGISKHFSAGLGVRIMPESDAPFKDQLDKLVEDQDVTVSNIRMSNLAITPEFRYYPGKRGWMRGFYIAAYGRYAEFRSRVPFKYTSTVAGIPAQKEALFGGPISSYSGGLMFGMQYTFGKTVTLDVWLIGAHYGHSTGALDFTTSPPLTPVEQTSLQQALNNIESDFFSAQGRVYPDGSGGTIDIQGKWAGVRALGINLGFRF